jgi:predicted nucleotidyltransferase
MSLVTEQALAEIVKVIIREVDPEAIYLFGSRARDEADAQSDIDLLVVEGESRQVNRDRFRVLARLYRLLAGYGVAKDILLFSRSEVERWRNSINHVVARALREGKLLYERI